MDALARHQCMIYGGSPAKHLPGLAALMYGKLKTNRRCLYLNSPTMVAGIRSYLAAAGLDVAHELEKGALVLSSEQSHLTNGRFDVSTMLGMLVDAVDRALKDGLEEISPSIRLSAVSGNIIRIRCQLTRSKKVFERTKLCT